MTNTKSILQSKTVWAAVVAVIAGLAGIFGFAIGPDDQAQLVELITGIGAALGGFGAIYGRVVASKAIAK